MLPLQQTIQFSDYSELYDLIIPQDNLLRRINDLVDFSFIQKELMDKYCHDNGRMAESPVMMFKYLLTSSLRHPKIFVEEFGDALMPFHHHGSGVNILV